MTQTDSPTIYKLTAPMLVQARGVNAGTELLIPAGVCFVVANEPNEDGGARIMLISAGHLSGMIVDVRERAWKDGGYDAQPAIEQAQ